MNIERPRRKRPRIELIPMIDTIFFILVFFVVASVSMVHQRGMRVDLPTGTTGERAREARVNITVRADGSLFLDKQPVTREALKPTLHGLLSASPDLLIVVNADRKAQHGRVVEVMDSARRAGARAVTIAIRPEREG